MDEATVDETIAEVNQILGNFQATASEAQHSDLLKKVQMMIESKLETQVQKKLQPLIEKDKEISEQNDKLAAENNALRTLFKSYQSNVMREIEEPRSQKTRLAEELQKKQAEVSQMTANNSALNEDLDASKNSFNEKYAAVTELQRTLLQIKKISRKYKMQFDELKVKYDDLEAESKSTDASNQEQTLQEKLEDTQKTVKELKEEIEKEKESASLSKQAQIKATEKEERAIKLLSQSRQKYSQVNKQKESLSTENKKLMKEIEDFKSQIASMTSWQEETNMMVARLEEKKRVTKEVLISEKDYLQVTLPGKQLVKPSIELRERASGSGTERLTWKGTPLIVPSTTGVTYVWDLPRNSPRPLSAITRLIVYRPTPTTNDSAFGGTASPAVSVPHPVQPIPVTATVVPTTMPITVSPDVSAPEVNVNETSNIKEHQSEALQTHVIGIQVKPSPVTALVTPRIDVTDVSLDPVTAESPAPTTSVIGSPPATQVHHFAPSVKRTREESPSSADVHDGKRMRMISEGSQTSQHSIASAVAGASNVAVAQVVPCNKSQDTPVESHLAVQSIPIDVEDAPVVVIASALQPSTSTAGDVMTETFTDDSFVEFISNYKKLPPNVYDPVARDVKQELIDEFVNETNFIEDAAASKLKERLQAYADKKAKEPALVAKYSVVLDVKPWDDETDMQAMEKAVRAVQVDGLVWGTSKLVPLAYGKKKLQIIAVVEDGKVSIDCLHETISEIKGLVRNADIAAFNKL